MKPKRCPLPDAPLSETGQFGRGVYLRRYHSLTNAFFVTSSMANLLIVDDDPDVLLAARLLLKRQFTTVDLEKNPARIPFLLSQTPYDVILLDMNFADAQPSPDVSAGKEGFAWLDRILAINPATVVVLFTAYGDVEMAVRAIKAGAVDFVLKPWENDKLAATLQNALEKSQVRQPSAPNRAAVTASRKEAGSSALLSSPAMQPVLDTIRRVADTEANVLILGENGTGKDLVAREIHRLSGRAGGAFVSVDVGALTESLFESELFGYVRGAFTDAREDRAGRFEEAQGGTIFLDEIGNIGPAQQARLLTVLEQRQVTRVGSGKARPIDVRLLCATNADLYGVGQFRRDLLYRINTIEIRLPALRHRPDDVLPLAERFLKEFSQQYNRPVTTIDPAFARQLRQYSWPGNVRELRHTIERAVILQQSQGPLTGTNWQPGPDVPGGSMAGNDATNNPQPLEEMERRLIEQAMQQFSGNISDVARTLGLSRQALYRRLEKYGL